LPTPTPAHHPLVGGGREGVMGAPMQGN
jgi:predicted Rossmann-fold nucleotide-binding protein